MSHWAVLQKTILNPNLNKRYVLIKKLITEHRDQIFGEELLYKAFTHGKSLKNINSLGSAKKLERIFKEGSHEVISRMRRKG